MANNSSKNRKNSENDDSFRRNKKLKTRHESSLTNESYFKSAKINKLLNFYINLIKIKIEDKGYDNYKQLVIDCYQLFKEMILNDDKFLHQKSFLKLIGKVTADISCDVFLDNILCYHNSFINILKKRKSKTNDDSNGSKSDDQSIDISYNTCQSVEDSVVEEKSDYLDEDQEEKEENKDLNESQLQNNDIEVLEEVVLEDNQINNNITIDENSNQVINENSNQVINKSNDIMPKIVVNNEPIYEINSNLEEENESEIEYEIKYKGTKYNDINKGISCLIDEFINDYNDEAFRPNGLKLETIPIFEILTVVKDFGLKNNLSKEQLKTNQLVDHIFSDVKKIIRNYKKPELIIID